MWQLSLETTLIQHRKQLYRKDMSSAYHLQAINGNLLYKSDLYLRLVGLSQFVPSHKRILKSFTCSLIRGCEIMGNNGYKRQGDVGCAVRNTQSCRQVRSVYS